MDYNVVPREAAQTREPPLYFNSKRQVTYIDLGIRESIRNRHV